MLVHGYPWPDIFRCDRFPVDNDMCIPSQNPDPESAAEAAAAIAAASAYNRADTAAENTASMDADPAVFEAALQHPSKLVENIGAGLILSGFHFPGADWSGRESRVSHPGPLESLERAQGPKEASAPGDFLGARIGTQTLPPERFRPSPFPLLNRRFVTT